MAGPYTNYPYDTIVYVTTTINGAGYQGSGVLIAPDEVLTASHVVYSSQDGAATSVEVTPAYDMGAAPYGTEAATVLHYNTIQNSDDLIALTWSQYDYAVIHLANPFTGLGTMGLQSNFAGGTAEVSGYPTSAGGAQVSSSENITKVPGYTLYQGTALGPGSSGGPVWVDESDGPRVVGIISSASGTTGYFTGLTTAAFKTIEGWVAADDAPCFAAGTRIATTRGDVPVEALRVGDAVRTRGGGSAPVIWIGQRHVDCARHPRPDNVWPVRVRAHTFAPGRPRRDLLLSPDHAVFVRGALVPVRYLVNGATIVQQRVAAITYWHVELPQHDIVFAENLASESYLDTGNRGQFAGADAPVLHPDFARAVWHAAGCAPLLIEGAPVVALRRRLLARAQRRLGYRITRDPALAARDERGRSIPMQGDGQHWQIAVPSGTCAVRLLSRSFVPAEIRADAADTRRLGVAIAQMWRDGQAVDTASPALTRGWHAAEPAWRWTDGAAEIPAQGVRKLALTIAVVGEYWLAPDAMEVAAAA
ncbi:MAG: Hint domain-containing protein [Alphaproteobacteria bacterium]|nr:Hint domain-containing protein [Alphaproteobacteria bacterium]